MRPLALKKGYSIVKGYRILFIGGKRIAEHRHLMSKKLGRPLRRDETVHHKNGVKTDNRLRNLELWCKAHPYGQRVQDVVKWARIILRRYA